MGTRTREHRCTAYCVIYEHHGVCPMTCNQAHTLMLRTKKAMDARRAWHPPEKEEESKSTTPSTKGKATKATQAKPTSPVTRRRSQTTQPHSPSKEGP